GNGEVDLRRCEYAVQQVFQFHRVNAGQVISGDNLDVCQQIGALIGGIGDPVFNVAASDADLVNQLPVFDDIGVIGFAAQYVYGAGLFVVVCKAIAKQWAEVRVRDAPAGVVL